MEQQLCHLDSGHPCSHNLLFIFFRAGTHSHDCCLIRKPVTPFFQNRVHISALLKVECPGENRSTCGWIVELVRAGLSHFQLDLAGTTFIVHLRVDWFSPGWLSVHKRNKDQHSLKTEHSQKRLQSSRHWPLCAMNRCEQKVFTPFARQFVCCANTINNLLSETFCALLHVYKMIRDASL